MGELGGDQRSKLSGTIQHIELSESPIHVTNHRLRVYGGADGDTPFFGADGDTPLFFERAAALGFDVLFPSGRS